MIQRERLLERFPIALMTILFLSGCATNYYDTYKAENPEWSLVFPSTDATLEETVASIYAPPVGAYQRYVQKLKIFDTSTDPWTEIDVASLESGAYQSDKDGSYAVAAEIGCLSNVALERYLGERASWYLLENNKISAFDHYDFTGRCAVSNTFEPARGDQIPKEYAIVENVMSQMTQVPVHPIHFYTKGVAYVLAGRGEDAAIMLARGDEGFDPTGKRSVRFDGSRSVKIAGEDEAHQARVQLLGAMKREGVLETPPVGAR